MYRYQFAIVLLLVYGTLVASFRMLELKLRRSCHSSLLQLQSQSVSEGDETGSAGVEEAIKYLNSEKAKQLVKKMALEDELLNDEAARMNFWTAGNFVIESTTCTGILKEGLRLKVHCKVKGKDEDRDVMVKFPTPVENEIVLKNVLVAMATNMGRLQDTGDIVNLSFGDELSMPMDFMFNNVPHSAWVRAYLYDAAAKAAINAIYDPTVPNKSRMKMEVNYPEVNPAFDTYRLGTLLEMVRAIALRLMEEDGKRVRICVQQSLGEGIFTGLPLALSSMRPVLEKMDWGGLLTAEQKFQPSDNKQPRKEALLRFGTIGSDQVAEDDDVFIILAPQNVVGGMIVNYLEDMVKSANGRPVILINPKLQDRPSSNNMMQIRGRQERRDFADSFQTIYAFRLLYPSSGGYMFPISGLIAKNSYHSPWVAYEKEDIPAASSTSTATKENYRIIAAFDPYKIPDPSLVSKVFTGR